MSEVEKQEGQKTVVAFIAGLLIGGLLVWVFSSSPEQTPVDEQTGTDTEETMSDNSSKTGETGAVTNKEVAASADKKPAERASGSVNVNDQPAGLVVALNGAMYPSSAGWVAVRDYTDGVPGNILGAARYNEEEGLMPESVNLLRATEVGNTYQVVFYTENGDKVFDLEDDTLVEGIATSFTAE